MENATQALFIAAGVLIGILILSLGVYLFHIVSNYAEDTQNEIAQGTVAQFNYNFMQYDGLDDLTIQDIITVKNYAMENNKQDENYNVNDTSYRAQENNEYIDVYLGKTLASVNLILGKNDEELLTNEIKELNNGKKSNRFICKVEVNNNTGRVYKIYFYES